MKFLYDTYLEDVTTDLEVINANLDMLYEQAIQKTDSDDISLLSENVSNVDDEKFTLYQEALSDSLKSIWKAVVRMIKSVFSNSGSTFTTDEALEIIKQIKSASTNGKIMDKKYKNYIQRAFYLVAALGSSNDGVALREAYENGETVKFVTTHIASLDIKSIPHQAKFRICLGVYAENIKANFNLTYQLFSIIQKKGLKGFGDMGKMHMNESFEEELH